MKKILLVSLVSFLFTGCAQIMYGYGLMGYVDYAKTECTKMGYQEKSSKFNQCVETTATQLREREQNTVRIRTNCHRDMAGNYYCN
jgi:hypothetical protein